MQARKLGIILRVCIIIAALLTAAALVLLYHVNEYTIEITLAGEQEVTLEYGERYEEPGAEAVFFGSVLHKEKIRPEVTVKQNFGNRTPGTYLVKYTASCKGVVATAYRQVHIVDTQAPVITLVTDPDKYTLPNSSYEEEGFRAVDNCDGDITHRVSREESHGKVTYCVTDTVGNSTTVVRDIFYSDPIAPQISLKGAGKVVLSRGQDYVEPGFTASDNCDGDITGKVSVSGSVDINWPGNYTLTYSVTDSYGNTSSVSRTVHVKAISLNMQNVTPNGKVIYLTFDDGPGRYTSELLDVLKKYDVKATFFVTKTQYLSTIRRAAAEGHTIAIHTASHDFRKIYASEKAYMDDLSTMQKLIKEYTGQETTLLRFPGGSSNSVSKFNKGIMTRLTRLVQEKGYSYFDWNVDSDDAGGTTTAKGVFNNVIKGVKKHKNSVVLQHDTKKYSIDAVEQIIVWGLENGYTFLPLKNNSLVCHHNIKN